MDVCRCDGTPLGNSDHCPLCGCEEYEERGDCEHARADKVRADSDE